MRYIFIILLSIYLFSAEIYINDKQARAKFISEEINRLKNDKASMEQFYFIGKIRCYEVANIGRKSDRDGALTMLYILEYPLFKYICSKKIEEYFKDKFSKDILAKHRRKMHFGIGEKFGAPDTPEHHRGFLTCESLNRLNSSNIKAYQKFIDKNTEAIKSRIESRLLVGDGFSLFQTRDINNSYSHNKNY